MKRRTVSWGKWCSLLFLVWFSLGVLQANAQKARGGTVKPDQRIALADSAKGTWAGQDVSIDYQYTRNQSGMSITGAVNFEDSIRYNYNRITY